MISSFGGGLEESVRCQESDIHVDLYSSLTSANSLNANPLTVLLSSLLNSQIVAVFIAKVGHVWVS